jgi:hypothetical protein
MLIAAGLALAAVLAQEAAVSVEPDAVEAPSSRVPDDSALWLGGAVSHCPENMSFEGRNLRLTEVPVTQPEVADRKAEPDSRAVPPASFGAARPSRMPCIAPAGR